MINWIVVTAYYSWQVEPVYLMSRGKRGGQENRITLPLQGHTLSDLKTCFLAQPLKISTATPPSWGPSIKHVGLWEAFKIQTIATLNKHHVVIPNEHFIFAQKHHFTIVKLDKIRFRHIGIIGLFFCFYFFWWERARVIFTRLPETFFLREIQNMRNSYINAMILV